MRSRNSTVGSSMPRLAQSLTTPDALGRVVRRVLKQRLGVAVTAVVQAEQDARRKFDGYGSHAEVGPALKVVQEGLQGLVQDLIRGLGRMDITPARPVAGPGVQLLDVQALQGVL